MEKKKSEDKKKTKLEDELLLFAYMRINKHIPDKIDVPKLAKGKSWRTIQRYLDDLQECMDFRSMDLRLWDYGEIPLRWQFLYRNLFLLNQIMDAANAGVFYCENYPDIVEPPKISAVRVQERYAYELGLEIPLRDVQRDVKICKSLLPEIQEQNGMEDMWDF